MGVLAGHAALVTGAGRGIGRAVAELLGDEGVRVALVARSRDEVDEVAAAINGSGGHAIAVSADLADRGEIVRVMHEVGDTLGPIDLLVNNAAIVGPLGRFSAINIEDWDYANAINLLAPVRLSRALLPGMLDAGWGRIVNVTTGAVNNLKRDDGYNSYVATKAGLEGHTMNLAAELEGTGVTANAFRPGIVDTQMQTEIRSQDPNVIGAAFHRRFVERYEAGQLLTPDVPARDLVDLLRGERNGEIVSTKPPEPPKTP